MEPKKLGMMLEQWARANAPVYGVKVEGVDVAVLGLADSEMLTESGERGGVFPISLATLTVRQTATLVYADERVAFHFQDQSRFEEFTRLYFQVCHDIWMNKDIAVRGRIEIVR